MAKFPIIRSTKGLPGTSTAVRAGFDPTTDAGAVGQAVGEFGVTIGSKIKQRSEKREALRQALEAKNRKNLDVRETRKAQLATEDYLRDVDTIKKTTAPENWADAIDERSTQYKGGLDTLNLSPEARERRDIETIGIANKVEDEAFIDGTLRLKITAIDTAKESSVALFRAGRPAREDLREQIDIMRFNGMNLKEIEAVLDTAKEAGLKLRNKDAVEAARNLASINPEQSIETLDAELQARKSGKGTISEEELSNEDLVDTKNYAESIISKQDSDSKLASEQAIKTAYSNIRNGATDLDAISDAIDADPTISDEDANVANVKIGSMFKSWNPVGTENVVTSTSMQINARRIIQKVKRGEVSLDDALESYQFLEKQGTVNKTDNKSFISQLFKAEEDAESLVKQRNNDILGDREKQLRDAIESQPNIFDPDIATEILKDFANEAVIELNNKFRDGDFTDDDVKPEVNRLMRKYRMSEDQQIIAVDFREFALSESLEKQTVAAVKLIKTTREQGNIELADELETEFKRLGVIELEESGAIKKKTGKAKAKTDMLKQIIQTFRNER
jgi:hypothetical protein